MRIRALIVDDEPLAREGLELALAGLEGVDVVGSRADGESAVRAIRALHPDLVFLDIRMPGLDGFEVIETVGIDAMPAVVFLTAYEEFALQAFRVNAIDYLLKPVDADALRESVERARRRLLQDGLLARSEQLRGLLDALGDAQRAGTEQRRAAPAADAERRPKESGRIVVRSAGRVRLVDPNEITWIEADGDYVTVHAAGTTHLVRDSLKAMEARLAGHGFLRIHRSSLVNRRCIRELISNDSGDGRIVLADGTVLRMSRNYRDAVYAALDGAS